ncbi:MAG TPA: RNA methyltransferase [Chlamydiales bacterium]|nr:RNA methyltransferase [Chlamydiales bacterium]
MTRSKEIISSLKHPLVQELYCLNRQRAERQRTGSCVIEGKTLITDLLKKRAAKRLLITAGEEVPQGTIGQIIEVERHIIEKISTLENPDNWIAEFEMPLTPQMKNLNFIVALDGLQDPGNVGTIMRTALALGWQAVFLIEPACDPFNDKALRAAKGATFDLQIQKGTWQDLEKISKENTLPIFAADSSGNAIGTIQKPDRLILVLGNEGHGIHAPENIAIKKISIPIQSVESLNVAAAGAILLYSLQP